MDKAFKREFQEINPYNDRAIDIVTSVMNRAKEKLGVRQTLSQLAATRNELTPKTKVQIIGVNSPIPITSEQFLKDTIEKKWKLTDTFMYTLKYLGESKAECTNFYYFEAVFSQPTVQYPIPQATVSVFFTVQENEIEAPEDRGVPYIYYRIEGHNSDHDIRYVTLNIDWILAVLKMKIKLFSRIEAFTLF